MPFYLRIADHTWPVLSRLMGGHARVYRATRGRIGHHLPGIPPVCLLNHVGARTGKARTAPLIYIEDGDTLFVVASKGGYAHNPAWYYNLLANPDTTVQIGPELRKVHARVVEPDERERLWPKAVAAYPGYGVYGKRTGRKIPLVILEARS